jgi:hypothetical protein
MGFFSQKVETKKGKANKCVFAVEADLVNNAE